MVNTDKLKGLMREKRKTQQDCAVMLGIQYPTFNQKLNNVRPFFLSEAETLQKYLGIPDNCFAEYFFYQESCVAHRINNKMPPDERTA